MTELFSRLLQEAKVEQGERARSPSPHVRLRAADLCTSHRRGPQVEVDLLSTFDGLPLQAENDQPSVGADGVPRHFRFCKYVRNSISRPHGGLRSSSWALWAQDRQNVGRDNIKLIPYGLIYRATTVTNVTFEYEYAHWTGY